MATSPVHIISLVNLQNVQPGGKVLRNETPIWDY